MCRILITRITPGSELANADLFTDSSCEHLYDRRVHELPSTRG